MKCPNLDCGLVNPPDAIRCDCGYNSKKGMWEPPINTQSDRNPKYSQPDRQIKLLYKEPWFIISATVAICIFVGYFVGNYITEDNKPSKNTNNKSTTTQARDKRKIELTKGQIEYIKDLIEKDVLYIKDYKVYITPLFWHGIDAQLKEDLAAALAVYIGNANDSTTYFCDIYDKMPAKKLAEYGALGLKVY